MYSGRIAIVGVNGPRQKFFDLVAHSRIPPIFWSGLDWAPGLPNYKCCSRTLHCEKEKVCLFCYDIDDADWVNWQKTESFIDIVVCVIQREKVNWIKRCEEGFSGCLVLPIEYENGGVVPAKARCFEPNSSHFRFASKDCGGVTFFLHTVAERILRSSIQHQLSSMNMPLVEISEIDNPSHDKPPLWTRSMFLAVRTQNLIVKLQEILHRQVNLSKMALRRQEVHYVLSKSYALATLLGEELLTNRKHSINTFDSLLCQSASLRRESCVYLRNVELSFREKGSYIPVGGLCKLLRNLSELISALQTSVVTTFMEAKPVHEEDQ